MHDGTTGSALPAYSRAQLHYQYVQLYAMGRTMFLIMGLERTPRMLAGRRLKALAIAAAHLQSTVSDVARDYGHDVYAVEQGIRPAWGPVPGVPEAGPFVKAMDAIRAAEDAIGRARARRTTWDGKFDVLLRDTFEAELAVMRLDALIRPVPADGIWTVMAPDGRAVSEPGPTPLYAESPRTAAQYPARAHAEAVARELDRTGIVPGAHARSLQDMLRAPDLTTHPDKWLGSLDGTRTDGADAPQYDPEADWKRLVRSI